MYILRICSLCTEYGLREFSNLKVNVATGSCGTTPSNCPCIKGGDVCTNKGITSPESCKCYHVQLEIGTDVDTYFCLTIILMSKMAPYCLMI